MGISRIYADLARFPSSSIRAQIRSARYVSAATMRSTGHLYSRPDKLLSRGHRNTRHTYIQGALISRVFNDTIRSSPSPPAAMANEWRREKALAVFRNGGASFDSGDSHRRTRKKRARAILSLSLLRNSNKYENESKRARRRCTTAARAKRISRVDIYTVKFTLLRPLLYGLGRDIARFRRARRELSSVSALRAAALRVNAMTSCRVTALAR